MRPKARLLALVAAKALHRQHVAHAFFNIAGGHRPGGAAGLAATAQQARKRQHGDELQRQNANRKPDQFRCLGIVGFHHEQDQEGRGDGQYRRHDGLEEDVLQRRGVVHHPVQAVANALVGEQRHGQAGDALEQLRAQQVVEGLAEAQLQPELGETQKAGELAECVVGFVFRARRGIVTLGQNGVRLIVGATIVAESADDHHHEHGQRDHPTHHAGGGHAVQETHERDEVEREPIGVDGLAEHHIVDDDLQRPRQDEGRQQREPHDEKLGGEPHRKVTDVGDTAPNHTKRLAQPQIRFGVERARGGVECALERDEPGTRRRARAARTRAEGRLLGSGVAHCAPPAAWSNAPASSSTNRR